MTREKSLQRALVNDKSYINFLILILILSNVSIATFLNRHKFFEF